MKPEMATVGLGYLSMDKDNPDIDIKHRDKVKSLKVDEKSHSSEEKPSN